MSENKLENFFSEQMLNIMLGIIHIEILFDALKTKGVLTDEDLRNSSRKLSKPENVRKMFGEVYSFNKDLVDEFMKRIK